MCVDHTGISQGWSDSCLYVENVNSTPNNIHATWCNTNNVLAPKPLTENCKNKKYQLQPLKRNKYLNPFFSVWAPWRTAIKGLPLQIVIKIVFGSPQTVIALLG